MSMMISNIGFALANLPIMGMNTGASGAQPGPSAIYDNVANMVKDIADHQANIASSLGGGGGASLLDLLVDACSSGNDSSSIGKILDAMA